MQVLTHTASLSFLSKSEFLVDVNLPRSFSFFHFKKFHFVADIDPCMTDTDIWNLALKKNLIILTRDVDFYSRALVAKRVPKIVYFKLGNITLRDMYKYFNKH